MELTRPAMAGRDSLTRDQSGQAVTEYILLLAVVVMLFTMVLKAFDGMGAQQLIMSPITVQFAAAYRYGHPKAKGFDDGGPENHPRAAGGGTNFRLFLNPRP